MVGRKLLIARRNQGLEKGQFSKDNKKQKGKGARWAKGHSCESNPTTTKHREQASSMFLHPVSGKEKSMLTVKNLAASGGNNVDESDDDGSLLSSDIASLTISDNPLSILSSGSSVKSLASGWSQISHNAFERFMRKFQGNFAIHKDMLSILAATSEVINDAGGKKNETEFFATFMTLLDTEACLADQYQPIMSLVCIVIGKVSVGVLRLRFKDIYPKIVKILNHAVDSGNDLLIRTTVEAFCKLIKVQPSNVIQEDPIVERTMCLILKCSMHDKPRVRRKVRKSIKSVLTTQDERCSVIFSKIVIGWILDQFASFQTTSPKVVADALTLLGHCWSGLKVSVTGSKKIFEAVLRVMSSGDPSIIKIGLSFFTSVFQQDSSTELDTSNELTLRVIVYLWDLQPDWRNTDTYLLWLTCVLVGMVRSSESNAQTYCSYLPSLLEKLSPLWLTNHGKKVVQVLKEYLPHIVSESTEESVINSCFQALSKNYFIVPPNPYVLQTTESLMESLSEQNFTNIVKDMFLQLAPTSENPNVRTTLGKFIKSFGVEKLWNSVDSNISWNVVLPLTSENLHDSRIKFWKEELLPLGIRSGKLDVIWESLVGFCRNPKDPENFPAELIGKVIHEKAELRLSALAALRQFIDWAQCRSTAIKYSKNFLPLLFNLYIQEKTEKSINKGHGDAIGVTIVKYLPLCESGFVDQLLEKALEKLETAKEEEATPIYDLVAFLVGSTSNHKLQAVVLQAMVKSFPVESERKRTYRVLASLAKNSDVKIESLGEIYKILEESKGETKSNAASVRLECINVLTAKNTEWLREFLLEVILNLISFNAKAKKCAVKFVNQYCSHLKESGSSEKDMNDIILTGLKSASPLLIASTMYFTALVYKELSPSSLNPEIFNAFLKQLDETVDQLVLKYGLSFVNLCLSLYKGGMGPFASEIGAMVGQSKYPRKEVNKILARMIKVFGSAGLKAVLPNSEDPKMRSRIKNMCRKIRKMKEEKTKPKEPVDGEDMSDEENDDGFGVDNSDVKAPVIIKEGLVDFLCPQEITQALVSDRKLSKPDDDFKLSKDGKLIIGNADGSDDDDDDQEDSDNDAKLANSVPQSRKRKISGGSVASTKRSYMTKASFASARTSSSRKHKHGEPLVKNKDRKSGKSKKLKTSSVSSRKSSSSFRK